ncbi:hypothetical protein HUT19_38980 [Streptomyces sp. NA02950]|uniref:hypothetical protein n=1 Tax=Streptomyces sp. NA02950 TaxID=2742137 RepID=UPI001591C7C0|nr:hypothetical protein [Streptomyces sp. NA02950]QKV96945.1 hypothetical protein HUT19_38980 [Streptomyces sp. NA02950]
MIASVMPSSCCAPYALVYQTTENVLGVEADRGFAMSQASSANPEVPCRDVDGRPWIRGGSGRGEVVASALRPGCGGQAHVGVGARHERSVVQLLGDLKRGPRVAFTLDGIAGGHAGDGQIGQYLAA